MKWLLLRPAHVLRVGVVACALAAVPTVAKADQIDRVLVNDSADVAERVAGLKARHIAVLPFQVKIGSQPATFKQGLEGTQLANKLQNLLILTNPAGEAGEYTVLGDAGKTAAAAGKARGKAIDWTTPEGRKALLALQLPVVWDDAKKLAPDTYLTGELTLTADLKGATVKLVSFSAKDGGAALKSMCNLQESATAKIRVDRNTLADLGKSFAVSKSVLTKPHAKTTAGRTKAVVEPDETASESAAGAGGLAAGPSSGGATAFANCPVELTVIASGQPIAISPDGSNNFRLAKTPPPGTDLSFNLKNTGDKAVAVLLTIDGINVIQIEDDQRADVNANREKWRKFVLQPGTLYTIAAWRKSLDGTGDKKITVDTEQNSAARFATMQPATAGKIELLVYPANTDVGTVPTVTPASGDGGGTPAGVGGTDTVSTDMPTQAEQAYDASPMEQMDKSIAKTKSARRAKDLVLAKFKGFSVSKTSKAVKITPPAPASTLTGKLKGVVIDGGGQSAPGGVTTEEKFEHAVLPMANVTVTYYAPEMVAQ